VDGNRKKEKRVGVERDVSKVTSKLHPNPRLGEAIRKTGRKGVRQIVHKQH